MELEAVETHSPTRKPRFTAFLSSNGDIKSDVDGEQPELTTTRADDTSDAIMNAVKSFEGKIRIPSKITRSILLFF